MSERVEWTAAASLPSRGDVLHLQGIPPDATVPARIEALLDAATAAYLEVAEPRAIVGEITPGAFAKVYRGEGRNAPATPLDVIVPKAERLALFAATVGAPATARIRELFDAHELALGCMLDSVCSAAADRLAELLSARDLGRADRSAAGDRRVLPYSPGYCGWDVRGQKELFAYLRPEQVGITLNASCLMQPLKSVSGVLVAGPALIHKFKPAFPFCEECRERPCLDRMRTVLKQGLAPSA
jgi:hypothetical protein